MFAGLDVGFKRTAVCVVDEAGRIVWRGVVDTHPEALSRALQRWGGKLAKIGLESGSMTPWLVRELAKVGFPVVCMDARAAADAVKSRRVKSDKADAYALAEMLRTGWYRAVYVKSQDSHRLNGGARSVGASQTCAGQSGARTTAAVWYSTAVAAGDQEVRRGGASGGAAR
jgi:transposase